ncbi:hypothetical protein [Nonomuraea dietziae]|uniref:hypothetical protein n=1 Tax=Nonomuraea dietziae TaxID=65515 RepID=UPI0031D60C90
MSDPVLQVADLDVRFGTCARCAARRATRCARGEVLGIVGESGSGKSGDRPGGHGVCCPRTPA